MQRRTIFDQMLTALGRNDWPAYDALLAEFHARFARIFPDITEADLERARRSLQS